MLFASPVLADDDDDEPDPAKIVFFGSLEAGPGKTFTSFGSKQAFGADGLDAGGFRLMNKLGLSREQARRLVPRGKAYKVESQFLIGYEWRFSDSFFSLYAGPDIEAEYRELGCGCYYGVSRISARLQADLWATPTDATMVQLSAYVSGLDRRAWGRLALGHKIDRGLHLGPEVELYRQSGYDKLRVGLHLTGLRLFGATWRLSGGWEDTSDRDVGAYATLGVHWTESSTALPAGSLPLPFQRRPQIRP
ncbi:cellulose biosynthesis protein BcsS [Bosea caraganae]|uniref:Cellulose biosynthesis protein BcsS n=1 Tax=Bosea caraganae TaxID=2763117 RepID=A0A370LBM0_9HYPH|nr:cellulose biosynthesis protein BcsS [Bosea caraganae]RDJ27356.1 cellulose biosynthesis protein BcsS [Bosea caraganae]RDJ29372.1 cellulose biosynthesis protein BcsS [Bosea caraganae]